MAGTNTYDRLKKELPAMAKISAGFPESLQARVLELLVTEFQAEIGMVSPIRANLPARGTQGREIAGIAHLDDAGKFYLTVRDPKAKSTNDAARRLTYVTLRAFELLTGDAKVPTKKVLNPILSDWRCYTGNTRQVLSDDKGLHRDGLLAWLDSPAKEEADRFIKEIQDPTTKGMWAQKNGGGTGKKAVGVKAKSK